MINNLIDNKGYFIKYNEFCEKFGSLTSQFQYMSLIDAIPKEWKQLLKKQTINTSICSVDEPPFCKMENIERNIQAIKSAELYWYCISKNITIPTCIKSWKDRINVQQDESFWKKIFILPYKCTNSFKIKELQIKIIHRFYPCQTLVAKWDESVLSVCKMCEKENADIVHTFVKCPVISTFWQNVSDWIKSFEDSFSFEFNCESILLGILPYSLRSHKINHCLLYGKHFIHVNWLESCKPSFDKFLCYYMNVLQVEKELFTVRNERQMFTQQFGKMYECIVNHVTRSV